MADGDRDGLPVWGYDYDLTRWSKGDEDERGSLVWHTNLPTNRDWKSIRYVTVEWEDEDGNPHYRNQHIHKDRPLDVYGGRRRPGEKYFYDLDDLVWNLWQAYGFYGE